MSDVKPSKLRSHCKKDNYDKIQRFIANEVEDCNIKIEYQITGRIESATLHTASPIVVFTFSYGSNESLSKIKRFMKLIGEDHV